MTVFSAHQMGTARMGADPKKSCVDPQGECWEVRPATESTQTATVGNSFLDEQH